MRILFETVPIKEMCSGCKVYSEHLMGKNESGAHVFKCAGCGRVTTWQAGDQEKVVNPGASGS